MSTEMQSNRDLFLKPKLVECPRDAMQGIIEFIPTDLKVSYLNSLLKVGFDTLDFGSFVSPKAIPQLKDTAEIVDRLELTSSKTKLLAIIANLRGAQEACTFEQITYLGFPLSLSETFQQRNTNKSIAEAFEELSTIQDLAVRKNKQLVVYLSMGFGNPYNDPFNIAYIEAFVTKLSGLGVKIICPSDTIGIASPENITYLFTTLIDRFPAIEFGAHFHTTLETSMEKIDAAYKSGCTRFDGAIRGYGGCPMAVDKLVGNMATENIIAYFDSKNIELGLDSDNYGVSMEKSHAIFK